MPLMGRLMGRRLPPTANLFLSPLSLLLSLFLCAPEMSLALTLGRRVVVMPIGMAVVETGNGGGGRNPFCSSPAKRFP